MKKNSNYRVDDVLNSADFEKNDRIEWLKQLYAKWFIKRNLLIKYNKETYLIYEPEEFDT